MVRICGKGGFAGLRATPEASRNAFAVPTVPFLKPFIHLEASDVEDELEVEESEDEDTRRAFA